MYYQFVVIFDLKMICPFFTDSGLSERTSAEDSRGLFYIHYGCVIKTCIFLFISYFKTRQEAFELNHSPCNMQCTVCCRCGKLQEITDKIQNHRYSAGFDVIIVIQCQFRNSSLVQIFFCCAHSDGQKTLQEQYTNSEGKQMPCVSYSYTLCKQYNDF